MHNCSGWVALTVTGWGGVHHFPQETNNQEGRPLGQVGDKIGHIAKTDNRVCIATLEAHRYYELSHQQDKLKSRLPPGIGTDLRSPMCLPKFPIVSRIDPTYLDFVVQEGALAAEQYVVHERDV